MDRNFDNFVSVGKSRSGSFGKYVVTFLIALFIGLFIGRPFLIDSKANVTDYEGFDVFTDVFTIIKKKYVKEVDNKSLMTGAIDGMVRSLDPHSSYMTERMLKDMQIETKGKFGGVGIEVSINEGWLTVITPIEDSPAWDAGIEAGDKILEIDSSPTYEMSLMEAVWKMRGEKGKPVTLTIFREGFNEPKNFTIVRATIAIEPVRGELIDRKIGYFRIRSFSSETVNRLKSEINFLISKGADRLILDFRGNPGGLLDQAIDMASLFVKRGDPVVSIKGRDPDSEKKFKSSGNLYKLDMPIVVLINKGSASASEIVTGALQDDQRALVIGDKSFGKASVQEIINLRDGSGVRLTVAYYHTPSGKEIQNKGIEPDIFIANKAKVDNSKGSAPFKKLTREELIEEIKHADQKELKEKVKRLKLPLVDLSNDLQLAKAVELINGENIAKLINESAKRRAADLAKKDNEKKG